MQQMLMMLTAGLTMALVVYLAMAKTPLLAVRFQRYAIEPGLGTGPAPFDSWKKFVIGAIAPRVEKILPTYYLDLIKAQLRKAGFHGSTPFHGYLCLLALCSVGGLALGFVAGGKLALFTAIAGFMVGAGLPVYGLYNLVKKRQLAISAVLPDTVDLMTACVEAGLGLDQAISQLVQRRSKTVWAMNQELNRYLQEVSMGVGRAEALRSLGNRSGIEDLRHVVTALIQGDQLGVGVSQILRAQAQHLRIRRRQKAEEKAMKAPVKILFPLVFFIFPSIFVILLGPAAIMVLETFKHV